MLLEELDNYLLHNNSPYSSQQLLNDVPLYKRLEVLTDAYRSELKK